MEGAAEVGVGASLASEGAEAAALVLMPFRPGPLATGEVAWLALEGEVAAAIFGILDLIYFLRLLLAPDQQLIEEDTENEGRWNLNEESSLLLTVTKRVNGSRVDYAESRSW